MTWLHLREAAERYQRNPGWRPWADLLDAEHTRLLPVVTPGMEQRRHTGGWA